MDMPARPPDFEAEVRFLSREEGGRDAPPIQGYRPDIHYDDDLPDQLWMVWPRFIDDEGQELPDGTIVPRLTRARFFIVNDDLRATVHRNRLREGLRFSINEGPKRVAECRVTRVLSLNENAG
jgi:hypothetical protein